MLMRLTLWECRVDISICSKCALYFPSSKRKMPKDHLTKIKIMADYGDAYAWDQEGVCIGLSYNFPEREVIAQIEKELEEWSGWFMSNDEDLNFHWDDFHEKGLALAKRLKEAIRDTGVPVFYEPPFEDPNRMNHEVLEIE